MRSALLAAAFLTPMILSAETQATSTTIVISEFRTRGPNGQNDEFIELHNKSSATVTVGNYQIMMSDASGSTTLIAQLAANVKIPAGHFYLLANNAAQGYSASVAPNATYNIGIPDDGGIALLNAGGSVVDEVGMSLTSAYFEGTPLAPMTKNVVQSYERNDGGCSPNDDTDDNAVDFRFNATQAFPQNAAVSCNPCQGVKCTVPPNKSCFNATGTCSAGSCNYTQLPEGTVCDDGDACTSGDACTASGACVGATQCGTPPAAFCSDPQTRVTFAATGTCSTSGCTYAQTSTPCQFGCNGTTADCNPDPCGSVTCVTPPTNGCYDSPGTCSKGTCSYPTNPANTPCTDGNACTTNDLCDDSGNCLPGTAVPIDDSNPCTADKCDTTTGLVSHTAVTDGTNCDDGNLCNGVATCQSGLCKNGPAVTCNTPPIGGCTEDTGTCDQTTGVCTYPALAQGKSCDDGNSCTSSDECDGHGACAGSSVGCSNPPGACYQAAGTCTGGACVYGPLAAGSSCDDGNVCTTNDGCDGAGHCSGTLAASCSDGGTVTDGGAGGTVGSTGGTTGASGGSSPLPDGATATGGAANPDSGPASGGTANPDSGSGSGGMHIGDSGAAPGSGGVTSGSGGATSASGGVAGTGMSGSAGMGMSGSAGSGFDAGPDAGGGAFTSGGGGCGCSVPRNSGPNPWSLAGSVLAMLTAARRRARSRTRSQARSRRSS